jgi:MYXO-CTERM domain-containing protein
VAIPAQPGLRAVTRTSFQAAMGERLSTLEIAGADPRIIHATIETEGASGPAQLASSQDGGLTWVRLTPTPAVSNLGIVAVDRDDPQTLYFRVVADDGDKLEVSRDGGKTLRQVLAPPGQVLSSFVRLPNGHVLAGWQGATAGTIYRSVDAAASFVALPTPLHPRAFAERNGQVYAATDVQADGEALAVSRDEGDSWTRVMGFEDVGTRATCSGASTGPGTICEETCKTLVAMAVFPAGICPGARDAGSEPPDAGPGGDAWLPDSDAAQLAGEGGGCSCHSGAPATDRACIWTAVAAGLATLLVGRRRRRRSSISCDRASGR